MDFDTAKENILPLKSGRRADLMESALANEKESLEQEKKKLEDEITNYEGRDPLEPWYKYICWIEQCYFKSANDGGLQEVIKKCIVKFENDNRYKQDRRLVKLLIKYIDTRSNPQELYLQLYNKGFGTMVADLYIAWSYYFDVASDFKNTEAIFQKGFDAGAQPFDELAQAHQAFSASISKRVINNDEVSERRFRESMEEKRNALTRLNAHKKKYVGSLRTGIAVRHENPGKFTTDENQGTSSNQKVVVHQDDNVADQFGSAFQASKSILEIGKADENVHEPGPWNNAKIKKGKGVFGKSATCPLNFNILEDDSSFQPIPCKNNNYEKGICLPANWVSRNLPQKSWNLPIVIEEQVQPNSVPCYDKFLVYSKSGIEISLEEIRGFRWFKNRNISAALVKEYEIVLENRFENGVRMIPGFVSKNAPQKEEKYPLIAGSNEGSEKYMFPIDKMITDNDEISIEELLAQKFYRGEIKLATDDDFVEIEGNDDMDITLIVGDRRQSVYAPRKSFVPRKSIMRKSVYQPALHENVDEEEEEHAEEITNDIRPRVRFEELAKKSTSKREEEEAESSNNSLPKKRKLNSSDDVHQPGVPDDEDEETLKVQGENSVKESIFKIPSQLRSVIEDSKPKASSDIDVFKAPPPVERRSLRPVDQADDDANETCSTVQFNFFIKSQSVSTPISKKTVPRLVPISNSDNQDTAPVTNQAASTASTSGFTIYTDEVKSDENENATNVEHSGVLPSKDHTLQLHAPVKQLSTIMEMTETTQSTKSSVSEIESQMLKLPSSVKSTGSTDLEKPFYDVSTCRIPEEQTETVNYTLAVRQLPKTPGRFLEREPFGQTTPKFNLSSAPVRELALVSEEVCIPKLPAVEVSHVEIPETQVPIDDSLEIPATQDLILQKEQSTVEIPAIHDDFDIPATQNDCEIPATQEVLCNFEMSRIEIPSVQIEFSHAEIPETQEVFVSENLPPKEPVKFTVFEDSVFEMPPSTVIAPTILHPPTKNLNELNKLHVSRKENISYLTEDSQSKRKVSDEFLNLLSNSPVPDIKLPEQSDKEVSDLLKFSDLKSKTLENSFKSLVIDNTLKSASPTMNILDEDLNTEQFNFRLTSDKNSTIIAHKPLPSTLIAHAKNDPMNFSFEINDEETDRLIQGCIIQSKQEEDVFKVPNLPGPKPSFTTASASNAMVGSNEKKFEIYSDLVEEEENEDDLSRTIYHNNAEKPNHQHEEEIEELHSWEDEQECSFVANDENRYEHTFIGNDFNASTKLREAIVKSKGNPFCPLVRSKILELCQFEVYLENHVESCTMMRNISRLKMGTSFDCGEEQFKVVKFIAKGSFGSVFEVKNSVSNKIFAAKQERPANMYEYYICIELVSRLRDKNIEHMLPAFMQVHYALIANNASIFITDLSPYGTVIDVCNKIKIATGRNVDEYIGMILTSQLLSIIDFLHSCRIIHADVKPDNFLLMSKIEMDMKVPALQLIDFGSAIDMMSYDKDDEFNYVVKTENFTCCEMRENKNWTYQTDLFGLCGTAHVIIFGKYMEVEKRLGQWQPTTKFPRYFQKTLWDIFFNTLLNVPDCKSMPNLQRLKQSFLVEVMQREKYVQEKLVQFNNALVS